MDEYTIKVQDARPGMYVAVNNLSDPFRRVIEYPVVTGQGVFVNLLGGHQIGPLPLDAPLEVDANY